MMRPMTLVEELEDKLGELMGAICSTEDEAECAELISQYEFCEAELVRLSVA